PLDAVDVPDDPAVLAPIGVGAGAAVGGERRVVRAWRPGRLVVEPGERAQPAAAPQDVDAEEQADDRRDEHPEAAAADGVAAAGDAAEPAAAAGVFDLRGVERDVVLEVAHTLALPGIRRS